MRQKRKPLTPSGASQSGKGAQKNEQINITNNDTNCQLSKPNAAIQCARLLARLKQAPISTFQAREELHIAHPAGRVHNLRQQGHNIETHTCTEATTYGAVSCVALYVLIPDAEGV